MQRNGPVAPNVNLDARKSTVDTRAGGRESAVRRACMDAFVRAVVKLVHIPNGSVLGTFVAVVAELAMNLIRLVADVLHLVAIAALLYKVHRSKNAAGLSLKTQALYLAVFCCRYMDLFFYFISLYNTVMKVRRRHAAPAP